jgi:hypothetical protein
MLDPQLKIKNVSGDGNCAFWAALRSLQELKKLDESLNLDEFFFPLPQQLLGELNERIRNYRYVQDESNTECQDLLQLREELTGSGKPKLTTALLRRYISEAATPHLNEFCEKWKQELLRKLTNLNAANPRERDYFLMNHLRRKVSECAQLAIAAAARESLLRNMNNAFPLNNSDETQEGSVDLAALHSLVPDFRNLDWKLYLWTLCAEVNSPTTSSLNRFRQEAGDNFLQASEPVHYEYLMNIGRRGINELWLGASDIQYLAQAMKLPLLVVAPRDRRPALADRTGTIKDEIGCFFYDENGESLLTGINSHSLGDGDPAKIAELLKAHPNTVKIVFNGTNHFLAIVQK